MQHSNEGILLLNSKVHHDEDFSGSNIEDVELNNYNFTESVFNGCHFKNVTLIECDLSHTEHTEAYFTDCKFVRCNLNYSDFVYSALVNTEFSDCTFSHVEWRESEYANVRFEKCTFHNSTISLCIFRKCEFDDKSSGEFQGSSKRNNVFTESKLFLADTYKDFLLLNYGLVLDVKATLLPNPTAISEGDYLTKLSFAFYFGKWSTKDFIENVIGAILQIGKNNSRGSIQKIKYISNISKITIEEGKLSVFSIQFLIGRINETASQIQQPGLFMELAELILFLKTHQYKSIKEIEEETKQFQNFYADKASLLLTLENSYNEDQIQKLIDACIEYQGIERNSIQIVSVTSGSTIVQGIITVSCSIGGFLLVINFALSQIKKTIVNVKSIKKELVGNKKKVKKEKAAMQYLPIEIMQSGNTVYYNQINNIVNKYGTDLIQIEGKGNVQINVNS